MGKVVEGDGRARRTGPRRAGRPGPLVRGRRPRHHRRRRLVDSGGWDRAEAIALQPDGKLLLVGIFGGVNLARLELAAARWGDVAAAGYFGDSWPWDR